MSSNDRSGQGADLSAQTALAAVYLATLVALVACHFYFWASELGWLPVQQSFSYAARYENIDPSQRRETALYLIVYVVTPLVILGVLAFFRHRLPAFRGHLVVPAIVVVLAHVVASYGTTNQGVELVIFAVALALLWAGAFLPRSAKISDEMIAVPVGRQIRWLDLALLVALLVFMVPLSLERVASLSQTEAHKVSYFIGPALYAPYTSLIPGLDFQAHYGVALGPVFNLIMGTDWKSAVMSAVGLNIALSILFYVQLYIIVVFFVGSRGGAFFITLALFMLNFFGVYHFYAPSSYPTRFPLILVFTVAFALVPVGRRWLWLGCMAFIATLSMLWQAETGLYMMLMGAIGLGLVRGLRPAGFIDAAVFVALTIAMTALACLLMFGPRALSLEFVLGNLEPILFYATGWGSVPIKWEPGWNYFYALVPQIIGVTTLGWCGYQFFARRSGLSSRERLVFGILIMLALLGLTVIWKWVNRSHDAVMHQNGAFIVIVAAWWWVAWSSGVNLWGRAASALNRLGVRAASPSTTKFAAGTLAVVATTAGLLFVADRTNPLDYGLRSYAYYPTIPTALLAPATAGDLTPAWNDAFTSISKDDIALITDHSRTDEKVLVISRIDWAYLILAKRPPQSFFIPSVFMSRPEHIATTFAALPKVFLEKGVLDDLSAYAPDVATALSAAMAQMHETAASPRLLLFER